MNEWNIYELCLDKILNGGQLADGDHANVRFAPQTEATIITRDDGLIGAYIEAMDGNNPNGAEAGVICVAGGTVAEPYWERYGVGPRYETEAEIFHMLRIVPRD
ncbi:hypothetical protein [Plantibacter sp. CFBP 8804]|uniref:hypothetical protein n=1 Tax=Plantibacter sp. CFBP 8804 TaxID=2775270 RepID=UPI00178016EF|nr:hypothetical protein [Plantibacter sp. CFBP 8804]MBD8518621.1 hypothetical protein [Plantibacter sp. CFBP 8804]